MQQNNKIAVFILSNGRPDNVITYTKLRTFGYTGKIYIIVDDEDKTLEQYKKNFRDEVIVFSKKDYVERFDIMDNFEGNKVIVYARNACYDIARKLELDYFFEYEDDYNTFQHKFIKGTKLTWAYVTDMDSILNAFIDALKETGATSLSFAQGGDFIGGATSVHSNSFKRKSMNSFIFKVNDIPSNDTRFIGRMNDDVNTYLTQGAIGKLFFQIASIMLTQKATQSSIGGNTVAYKENGTYVKSFYSVMAAPSCCKISTLGITSQRIHHRILWNNAVPKIINEQHKKINSDNDKDKPVEVVLSGTSC